MTYDPDNNRLYVGTGNARGADAAKNAFACSVVALNADTGAMEWHYDSAPGDHLQCDGSTDITLATVTIGADRATSSSTRQKTALSTCSIAPAARRSP